MVYEESPKSLHCIYIKDFIRLSDLDGCNHKYAVNVIDSVPYGDTLLDLDIQDIFYSVWCNVQPTSQK